MKNIVHWLYGRSVHTKIAATIIFVVAIFGIFVSIINFYIIKTQTASMASEFMKLAIKSNEDFVMKSVLAKDYWSMHKFLKSISGNGFVEEVGFVDETGEVMAHTNTKLYKSGDIYKPYNKTDEIFKIELKSSNAQLGYFVVKFKREFSDKLLAMPMLFNMIMFFTAALVSILLGALITKRITARLAILVDNAKALAEKRWDDIQELGSKERDEISELVDSMFTMMQRFKLAIKSEEDLKEFYHQILSFLDMFVLILDEEFCVVYQNEHPIGRWGLSDDGVSINEGLKEKILESLSNGQTIIPCSSTINYDGHNKTILINSRRINNSYVVTFTDVTKIQELEKNIGLSRSLSLIGEISATFTHEIKNLLQPAKLLLGNIDKVDADDLRMVSSIVSKIDSKVLDFLSIGRPIDRSMSDFVFCKNSIDKTLFFLSYRLLSKNIDLRLQVDENATVFISEDKFESILADMLSNAIEACDSGGVISISASVLYTGGMTRISIEDNGVGVEEDIKEKIFEPFFTTKEKGSGLGLFGVYKTVYLYGGFIELSSKPGHTKFDIYLPTKGA